MNADDVCKRALKGQGASSEEARFLAERVPLPDLAAMAGEIRERFFGKVVQFCGIVNARSGACSEDCRFCAQSARYRTGTAIYPLLDSGNIVRAAKRAAADGAHSFGIVTSGRAPDKRELEIIASAVDAVPPETGIEVCASLGKLNENNLRLLKASGLNRYHHNLETSREFFPSICSTHDWDERIKTVRAAKRAGLKICSGGLFGMGETWDDRIALGLVLRELAVDSIPINFLHPIPGTPLENRQPLSPEEALRIIAVYRFILPRATMRICGGRVITLKDRQGEMFGAGANALMTGDYLTTAGADSADDRAMIGKLGLTHGRDGATPAVSGTVGNTMPWPRAVARGRSANEYQ